MSGPLLTRVTVALLLAACPIWFSWRRGWLGSTSSGSVARAQHSPAAPLLGLSGIVVDADGNLYVSARNLNRIFKVSLGRQVSVFAGTGAQGFAGDGGPARGSALAWPVGLALDKERNLLIADKNNNRIRRIDAGSGTISTVAGNGAMGGGTGALATGSGLYEPVSVAIDEDGSLFIGGATSLGIRRVDAITGIVSKVLGAGLPGTPLTGEPAAGPFWVALQGGGRIFFSDPSRNSVSWLDTRTGVAGKIAGNAVCTFAGDGSPTIGSGLCFPEGLTLSDDHRLLIADAGNNRIRCVDLQTGIITTIAGDGRPGDSGDGGQAVSASLDGPTAVALDRKGNLYIADAGNNRIRRLERSTGVLTTWAAGQSFFSAAQAETRR